MSIFYYATFLAFQIGAVYIISVNPKGKLNRITAFMFSALYLNMLEIAVSMPLNDPDRAELFIRFTSPGIIFFMAGLLTYTLVFTKHKLARHRYIIYLFALFLSGVLFWFNDNVIMQVGDRYISRVLRAQDFYELNYEGIVLGLYCLSVVVDCFILLKKYSKEAELAKERQQSRVLIIGLLLSSMATATTFPMRLISGQLRTVYTPFAFIPLIAMILVVQWKYSTFNTRERLTTRMARSFHQVNKKSLGLANMQLIVTNIFYFMFFYFNRGMDNLPYLYSLSGGTVLIYLVYLLDIPKKRQDIYGVTISMACMLAGSFAYSSKGVRLLWVIGMGYMFVLILSENRKLLYFAAAVLLGFEIYSSNNNLGKFVYYSNEWYYFRFTITAGFFYVSNFVYRNIKEDERENNDYVKFQSLLASLSVSASREEDPLMFNVDYLQDSLDRICEFFDVDKGYLLTRAASDNFLSTFTWGHPTKHKTSLSVPKKIISLLSEDNYIFVQDINRLEGDDYIFMRSIFGYRTVSALIVPIFYDGRITALLCLETERKIKTLIKDVFKMVSEALSNMIEKNEKNKMFYNYIYYDTNTLIPNRNMFEHRLQDLIDADPDKKDKIAVIFLGFARTKHMLSNYTSDHITDEHLVEITNRINKVLTSDHLVTRFGTDNLIIYIHNYTDLEAEEKAIFNALEIPLGDEYSTVKADLVMGTAIYPEDGTTVGDLVKNADMALNAARTSMGTKKERYTDMLATQFQDKIELTNSLYRALENGELVLYYQPQVDAKTEKIVGVEALIRWRHPDRGLISPGIFIPLAEDTGLITSIGRWVMEEACAVSKKWEIDYGQKLLLAVNVSVKQFKDTSFARMVESILRKTGLEPERLEIEVTESEQLLENLNRVVDNLDRVRERGVQVAIDDFGTRYSSLARLRYLPITKLKIDMGFVRALDKGEKHKALVQSIMETGKSLGMVILAEGVETREQYEFLRDNDADVIQGFYYYKPLPQEDIAVLLSEQAKEVRDNG